MAYLVKAFAQLAGVTVRTLHYYDRIDLLKPSDLTDAGHRVYTKADLVRLQQILLLKAMGFNLAQIKAMLNHQDFDLRQTLTIQQKALQSRIQELNDAAAMLEEAISTIDSSGAEALSPDLVRHIVSAVLLEDNWFVQFYSEDAMNGIITRSLSYSREEMLTGRQAWQRLIAKFEAIRHETPESDRAQMLAAEMHELISEFTGGDPEVVEGLATAYSHYDEFPERFKMMDQALLQFMNQVYSIYQKSAGA